MLSPICLHNFRCKICYAYRHFIGRIHDILFLFFIQTKGNEDHAYCGTHRQLKQATKKMGCRAVIIIRDIMRFPAYKVNSLIWLLFAREYCRCAAKKLILCWVCNYNTLSTNRHFPNFNCWLHGNENVLFHNR
jgi:hypothetical protein